MTFAFGGDVHFEGNLRWRLSDPGRALAGVAPLLASADVAMVNLETAITERGTPQTKAYNFRAPATAFTALRSAGVDVTTMANNHGIDYGPVGLGDSLAAMFAVQGVLMALVSRSATGRGQVVDTAMVDGAANLMASAFGALGAGVWNDARESNITDGGSHQSA